MSTTTNAATAMSTNANAAAALVFLHGLGDTPAGWKSLESNLPRLKASLKQLKYVFPPAPTIGISINNGLKMPGWFDLYDWPIGVGSQDDHEGMKQAVQSVHKVIKDLEANHGIPRNRIVVGGFSQGGAVALRTVYDMSFNNDNTPLAACVVLSGWLTEADRIEFTSKPCPCFWAHGEYDDKVLFAQQDFGVNQLRQAGIKVESLQYPMGHEAMPSEIAALADFLDNLLFPTTNQDGTIATEPNKSSSDIISEL